MTKAVRVTVEATKAAKDIASKDIVIWREARKIGLNLADMVDANDDKARADYWKALGATITYGPQFKRPQPGDPVGASVRLVQEG